MTGRKLLLFSCLELRLVLLVLLILVGLSDFEAVDWFYLYIRLLFGFLVEVLFRLGVEFGEVLVERHTGFELNRGVSTNLLGVLLSHLIIICCRSSSEHQVIELAWFFRDLKEPVVQQILHFQFWSFVSV